MRRSSLFARPSDARGIIPLILGALAAGKAIYGTVDANQKKQRNKGYIDDAYRSALQRQQVKEGDVRQGTSEDLASRGLLTNRAVAPASARIAAAMSPQTGSIAPSTTLGGRAQNENSREFALERYDLNAARNQAQRENKAEGISGEINSVLGGALGVANAASLQQLSNGNKALEQGATDAARSATVDQIAQQTVPGVRVTPSAGIANAMGIDNPDNWFGGIHGIRPLDAPGSSWNRKETLTAPGSPNYDFHL